MCKNGQHLLMADCFVELIWKLCYMGVLQSLSKKHACIEITTDVHLIYDLDSRNKTRRDKVSIYDVCVWCVLSLDNRRLSVKDILHVHSPSGCQLSLRMPSWLLPHILGMTCLRMSRLLSHCPHSTSDWKPIGFRSHFPDISCILTDLPGHYS